MQDLKKVYAIERLVMAYSSAANRKDFAAMADTFENNGRLVGMARMVGLDQEAIVGGTEIHQFLLTALSPVEYVFQNAQLGPVSLDKDEATAQVMLTELARWPDQGLSVFLGHYEDRYSLTSAGWRFAERKLVPSAVFQPSGSFMVI